MKTNDKFFIQGSEKLKGKLVDAHGFFWLVGSHIEIGNNGRYDYMKFDLKAKGTKYYFNCYLFPKKIEMWDRTGGLAYTRTCGPDDYCSVDTFISTLKDGLRTAMKNGILR